MSGHILLAPADADVLRDLVLDESDPDARRLVAEVVRLLEAPNADASFLEELGDKLVDWAEQGVTPTCGHAEHLRDSLQTIALAVRLVAERCEITVETDQGLRYVPE